MIENTFYPNTFCLECIQKHYCTAMSLACEFTYLEENEPFIIGELGCAILHCFEELPDLAKEIRDIRHMVQEERVKEIDWIPTYKKIKELIKAENKHENN